MKKAEMNTVLTNLLVKHNIDLSSALAIDLLGLSIATSKVVSQEFPPKYNEEGLMTHKYCLWHKEYEDITSFAKSSKSKDGYHYECKASSKQWLHYAKLIKELEENTTPEQQIVTINKVLDVIHQRGDLASAFIEGGKSTLYSISNESKKISTSKLL